MNETDEYILESIRTHVWSGFYDADEVQEMIDDILEDGADEEMLRAAVPKEFEKKAAEEASWPEETDCDRLDNAFGTLNSLGIIALHNAGYTMSDGLSDVGDELHERGRDGIKGYCFYHGQDLERAVNGNGLSLAFGDLNDNKVAKAEIGTIVREVMESNGFGVEWNGDPKTRIDLPNVNWQRRGASLG